MAAGCRTSALLDRLVAEKLKAEAETIAAEGWKWIEVAVSFPYDATRGLRELRAKPLDLIGRGTGDDRGAQRRAYQKLEAEYRGRRRAAATRSTSGSARSRRRCAAFDDSARATSSRPTSPRAGVFVSIAADGSLAGRSRLCPARG